MSRLRWNVTPALPGRHQQLPVLRLKPDTRPLSPALALPALQQQKAGAGADGQLSDAQLNALLARGEGELELFEAEDRRMRVGGRPVLW